MAASLRVSLKVEFITGGYEERASALTAEESPLLEAVVRHSRQMIVLLVTIVIFKVWRIAIAL
jgi:hypothetical protein